jgi:hypothetical protein
MKRRNFVAMSLRSAKFSQKVVKSKKIYNRKKVKNPGKTPGFSFINFL